MTKLRLKAETQDDLSIIAAAVQDAILRVGEITYNMRGRSLTIRMSRFRHEQDVGARAESGLRIDGVLNVKTRGIDRKDPEALAVLLNIDFDITDAPGGIVKLVFAGDGELHAQVEALEVILADVTTAKATDKIPLHPL